MAEQRARIKQEWCSQMKLKKQMENIDYEVIIKKIKRARRFKENRPGRNLPVIAKFTDWDSSERVKSSFIKATEDGEIFSGSLKREHLNEMR